VLTGALGGSWYETLRGKVIIDRFIP